MERVLVVTHQTTVRADAPTEAVWKEVSDVEVLLAHMAEVDDFDVGPDRRSARVRGTLEWGPLHWDFEGELVVRESTESDRFAFTINAPNLDLELEGTFDLRAQSSDASIVTYTGVLRCRHPFLARMRRVMTGFVEDEVERFASRMATLASQHVMAERRLGWDDSLRETDPPRR